LKSLLQIGICLGVTGTLLQPSPMEAIDSRTHFSLHLVRALQR
jgi:hypothetical protein